MALDVYQTVTDRIIELLDQGTVPWRHPIRGGSSGQMPTNLESQKHYRGINVFLLAVTAWAEGYDSPYWLTFKQAAKKGGHVRKGEKSSLVIFWKQYATKDKDSGEAVTIPVLRHYRVFNAEQCEGIEAPGADDPEPDTEPFEPIEEAARIIREYRAGPAVVYGGSRAFYRPSTDTVHMAEVVRFVEPGSYYSTFFHELAHSTGHSSRLARGLDTETRPFGSPDYSKEELVAEMGAAFLAAAAGIGPATIEQSAAYIDGWRKRLSDDKKLGVQAAGAGQRAADWILGARAGGENGGKPPSEPAP